jgi:hypothetical protein
MKTTKSIGIFKNLVTMKNIFHSLLISLCCLLMIEAGYAREFQKTPGLKSTNDIKSTAAGCEAGSSYSYLDINNVRTLVYSYGNGWFLENAEYEIPKGSGKKSMFSFSLWIGGIDINNNLKLAAYRYGQGPSTASSHTKNDFWPGPLTVDGTAAIEQSTCVKYDKLFPITRDEVQAYLAWWDAKADYPNYQIPKSITNWPAKGDVSLGQAYYMAPFYDRNGDGVYDPKQGDYPYYDFANALCPKYLASDSLIKRAKIKNGGPDDTLGILVDQVIKGDQTLWSVYNDKGNFHSETQGDPIGMEIRAQYFAFATNDEINNMTFYSYEIINRSTYTLTGTYFSQWVDPDLGWAQDDYVGCDVSRGLGYCYNGKPTDGSGQSEAYGAHPPAVGVDFFQGPYMDPDGFDNPSFEGDGVKGPSFHGDCSIVGLDKTIISMNYGSDGSRTGNFLVASEAINGVNFGDGIKDNERYGMRRFVYHNNNLSGVPLYMQDPNYASEYYNFLRGIWRDNTKMQYGGNAHQGAGAYGPDCDFMFPDVSDICNWGTKGEEPTPKKWTEETAKNNPSDRRFMQSAGPFTLRPGACNYITVGIPWARSQGTPFESVELLRSVDDKCQKLFDNCFAVLNGPNAPDVTIEEMNNSLILYLTNRKTNDAGSNFQEKYKELDPNIPYGDLYYHFEGYQIYQLKDASVSSADIDDPTKARLVAECDIQNGVTKLVNWNYDQNIGGNVGVVMVDGSDNGVKHSFVLTQDQFASGDPTLINHKQYYFTAIAYAYNQYKPYQPDSIDKGQTKPYLRGRSNIKTYTAIPHIPVGDITNGNFGDGPVITRLQGQGNGGMILEFSDQTIAEILAKPMADSVTVQYGDPEYPISYNPVYQPSAGPLGVTVIDPLNVVASDYKVLFDPMVPGPANNPFQNIKINFGKWRLVDTKSGDTIVSDTTTIYPYEQLFIDRGIALTINQVPYAGDRADTSKSDVYPTNGLLAAPVAIYADSSQAWLSGVPDDDVPGDPMNWIRAGTYVGGDNNKNYDFDWISSNNSIISIPWDPNKNFAKIQGGTWAPYVLAATGSEAGQTSGGESPVGAAFDRISKRNISAVNSPFSLSSVDIVLTPDKSKWTRCPVIEMSNDPALSEGGATKFTLRAHKSVNAYGDTGVISSNNLENSGLISNYGMGWFPGYALNLETGERLNIMFGENSWLVADNGRDMIFNPSSRVFSSVPVFGGQHYVYIMGSAQTTAVNDTLKFPAYDGGAYLTKILKAKRNYTNPVNRVYMELLYASTMYVGIPLAVEGKKWLDNEVRIKIRVSKPYQRYFSLQKDVGPNDGTTDNDRWPMYSFNTDGIATAKQTVDKQTTDMDLINIVPNPYYAYDDYEQDQLDNRVKITNLPEKCTVTIFDMSGTLIRQFNVDKSGVVEPRSSTAGVNTDAKTSIDWDIKNFAGIPISGGAYLIHVKAPGLGERTIKWFGILRPVDLNSL